MPISGMILKPNPGDPSKCYAYMINEVDLKISLPSFLTRQVYKD